VKDRLGRYRLVNQAFSRLMERLPHELLGRCDHELYDADVARRHVLGDLSVLASARPSREELRLDGPERPSWHQIVKTPLLDQHGEVAGILCTFTDITRYREAGQDLVDLDGMLPICSCCKRVRNQNNCWEAIDHDFNRRTPAAFTHGLCPECAKQLHARPSM